MNLEQPDEMTANPEEETNTAVSLIKTAISLLVFAGIYYWIFKSWLAVAALVIVITLHELGHFAAMKIYGYQSLNMIFVPFIGAYVSGTATNLSRKNKLVVLLAGPVPGIIIGCILLMLNRYYHSITLYQFAYGFLALNLFNLLPVFPLDGGQFLQVLFFNGSRVIQLLFLYLSVGVLIYLFYKMNSLWFLPVIAALILLRIRKMHFINRVRKKLDSKGIDYACSYDDLTDEAYSDIRNELVTGRPSLGKKYPADTSEEEEQGMIKLVEAVLVAPYEEDLGVKEKILFTTVWAIVVIIPVVIWEWMFIHGYV